MALSGIFFLALAMLSMKVEGSMVNFSAKPDVFGQSDPPILTLNCSVPFDPTHTLSPISLTIFHESTKLVNIDAFTGNRVSPRSDQQKDSSGFISRNGDSYLQLVLKDVSQNVTGGYRCEGKFMDQMGKIVTKTNSTTVTGTVSSGSNPITGTGTGPATGNDLQALTNTLAKMMGAEKLMKNYLFYNLLVYQGHTYYVSRIPFFDIDLAHQMCKFVLNGYLVKLDDQNEYNTIKKDLDNRKATERLATSSILIGASDGGNTGTFKNVKDNNTFASDIPVPGGQELCLGLSVGNSWDLTRIECVGEKARYLCEVE